VRQGGLWRYCLLAAAIAFSIGAATSIWQHSPVTKVTKTVASSSPRDPVAELYAYESQPKAFSSQGVEPISGFGRAPEIVVDAAPSDRSSAIAARPQRETPANSANFTNIDRLTLVGDTDRDGVIAASDLADREIWQWSRGAIVPVNLDDDDRDGRPDGLDRALDSGDRDLALLRLRLPESIASTAKIRIGVDRASRPYVNLFQRTARGWRAIDAAGESPIVFSRDVVLGVEARMFATGDGSGETWNGDIEIDAIVEANGRELDRDRLRLRVAPWLMSSPLARAETVYVTDIPATRKFAADLAAIVEPTGANLARETVGTLWMQDTMELGYTQAPTSFTAAARPWQNAPVVLDGVRKSSAGIHAEDRYAKTLLAPDFQLLRVATARSVPIELPEPDRWLDWYGNLEVSPPVPGFPLGRIYTGRSPTATFHPKLAAFFAAQQLQTPAVEFDTSWLYIRHIDEIFSFWPHPDGGSVVAIVSPRAGLDLLRSLQARGDGAAVVTLPNGQKATIDRLLADSDWVAHNEAIERDRLSIVRQQLQTEFGVTGDRLVPLPALFTRDGKAIWSNPVNALSVNGTIVMGDPKVRASDGDPVRAAIEAAIAPLGLAVKFIDDGYYHRRSGNVHCATNVRRTPPSQPFWRTLPASLSTSKNR